MSVSDTTAFHPVVVETYVTKKLNLPVVLVVVRGSPKSLEFGGSVEN